MNIVAIGAHQDDIEIHCLGTLLRYQQQGGHTFTNVTISNGDKGAQFDTSIPYAEIAKTRIGEATKVADALGGRYICMGESDEYIRDTDDVRNRLVDILREAKADIVFHPSAGGLQHRPYHHQPDCLSCRYAQQRQDHFYRSRTFSRNTRDFLHGFNGWF